MTTLRRRVAAAFVVTAWIGMPFWSAPFEPAAAAEAQLKPSSSPPDTSRAQPSPASAPHGFRRQAADPKGPPVLAVFGDVFAASVVRGLDDRDVVDSGWQVTDGTRDDASLAGPDAADPAKVVDGWLKRAGHVDAAVVMLGGNDDGSLRQAHGAFVAPASPEWPAAYGDRVEKTAAAFRDRHVPLIWVGLPIVRDPAVAQRYAAINEEVRDRAAKGGATVIDAWQAFADDNGDYTATGPDVNGRTATLRWTNGWNFTRAGAQKLASFVLPDLNRIRDHLRAADPLAVVPNANSAAFDQALSIDVNAQIRREAGLSAPSGSAVPAGPVVALTAPPLSTQGTLLPLPTATPGLPPPATPTLHPGRADEFAWPRP